MTTSKGTEHISFTELLTTEFTIPLLYQSVLQSSGAVTEGSIGGSPEAENIVHRQDYQVIKAIVTYGGPCFMLLGTIGNVLALIVVLKNKAFRSKPTGLHICVLAIVDTVVLNYGMPMFITEFYAVLTHDKGWAACK